MIKFLLINHENLGKVSQLRGEWPSGLKRCNQNQKVPGSNPNKRLAGFRDPTSARVSR